MKLSHILAAAAIVAIVAPSAALADTYMLVVNETEAFEMGGQTQPARTDTMVTWMAPDKSAVIMGSAQKIILDMESGNFIFMKPAEKIYAEFPADIMKAVAGQIAGEDKAKADSIRAMMTQMMGDMTYTVQPTDSTKTIGKWNTRKYIVTMTLPMGGKVTADSWVTKDMQINWEMYRALAMRTLAFVPKAKEIFEESKKLDGIGVLTYTSTQMMGMTMNATQRLLEFSADATAPEGMFAVPADYTKVDNPMIFMGQ